jgi:hypothetical protein
MIKLDNQVIHLGMINVWIGKVIDATDPEGILIQWTQCGSSVAVLQQEFIAHDDARFWINSALLCCDL